MDNNQNSESNKKADNPIKPIPPDIEKEVVAKVETNHSEEKKNDNPTVEPKTFIYSIAKNSKRKPIQESIANAISFISLLVSTFLALYTYLLFKETQKSTQAAIVASQQAIEATKISQLNYELAKKAQKENFALAKENQKQSDIAFKNSLDRLEKESDVTIQIFDEQNNGIVFLLAKPIKKSFILKNLGRYPVKILSANTQIKILQAPPTEIDINISPSTNFTESFISPSEPLQIQMQSTYNVNIIQFEDVTKFKIKFVYFYGFIIYENQITRKKKKYEFIVRNDGLINSTFVYNKTIDIK